MSLNFVTLIAFPNTNYNRQIENFQFFNFRLRYKANKTIIDVITDTMSPELSVITRIVQASYNYYRCYYRYYERVLSLSLSFLSIYIRYINRNFFFSFYTVKKNRDGDRQVGRNGVC